MKSSNLFKLFFSITFGISLVFLFPACEEAKEEIEEESPADPISDQLKPDTFESNNVLEDAKTISLDENLDVCLHEVSDEDYYKFTTAHSSSTYDKIKISLTALSQDIMFRLEIYSTEGELLDNYTVDNPGQNLNYTISCPGGTYILRISGWHEVMHSDYGSCGEYSMVVTNLYLNDDYVPNNTRDSSAVIEINENISGVIVSRYENDWFLVQNDSSEKWESFTFKLTNVSDEMCPYIAVYDENKEKISSEYKESFGSSVTINLVSKSNKFFIHVCGWDEIMHSQNGTSGSYNLEVIDDNLNDSYEPDDSFETSRLIEEYTGSNIYGTILTYAANNNDGDYEYYKINIPANTKISWTIDPEASNTELHYTVYDSNKSYLGSTDGDDGQTLNSYIDNAGSVDTYCYIKLGAFVGDNGNYTISFTSSDL